MMTVAFMASDAIALDSISFLRSSRECRLACIVSNPDRPKGRGKKMQPNAVSAWALENEVELLRPERGPDSKTLARMRELGVDIIIVMAYGCILKKEVLNFSEKYPCLNLHASLLPDLRGASPIESAIALGYHKTGVSLMRIEPAMDSGAVCASKETAISNTETASELRRKIGALAAELLKEKIGDVESHSAIFIPQKNERATYVRKLEKSDLFLDFHKSAGELDCRIRAFGAGIFEYSGEFIKILKARPESCSEKFSEPGKIIEASASRGLKIACADGVLACSILQRPCAKALECKDFFGGYRIEKNSVLKSFENKSLLR